MLRLTAVVKTSAFEQAPVDISLFGNSLQGLFGAPPDRFIAKVRALQASCAPMEPDLEAVVADPLVHVALQQCLIGEVFRFTNLREAKASRTSLVGGASKCFTAESMSIVSVSAAPVETILSVYVCLFVFLP